MVLSKVRIYPSFAFCCVFLFCSFFLSLTGCENSLNKPSVFHKIKIDQIPDQAANEHVKNYTTKQIKNELQDPRKNIDRMKNSKPDDSDPTLWIVAAGVNSYRDPAISDLQYGVADAEHCLNAFVDHSNYSKVSKVLLIDNPEDEDQNPSRFSISKALRRSLRQARSGDLVVVFFSGHAFLGDNGDSYLAPRDCDIEDLKSTGFPVSQLRELLEKCQASQKLLILDCCHAGNDRSIPQKGAYLNGDVLRKDFSNSHGLITLASCTTDQQSYESKEDGHGLFSYWLVKGLEGAADRDQNGIVDSDELYKFTAAKVSSVAWNHLRKRQTPVRIIGGETFGVFALTKVSVIPRESTPRNFDVTFLVQDSKSKSPIANATVELLYQPDETLPNYIMLARGKSGPDGQVQLKGTLTLTQQWRRTFFVYASKGPHEKTWPLTTFQTRTQWKLPLPLKSQQVVRKPKKKPAVVATPSNSPSTTTERRSHSDLVSNRMKLRTPHLPQSSSQMLQLPNNTRSQHMQLPNNTYSPSSSKWQSKTLGGKFHGKWTGKNFVGQTVTHNLTQKENGEVFGTFFANSMPVGTIKGHVSRTNTIIGTYNCRYPSGLVGRGSIIWTYHGDRVSYEWKDSKDPTKSGYTSLKRTN